MFGVVGVIIASLAGDLFAVAISVFVPLYLIAMRTFLRRLHARIISVCERNDRLVD